MIVLDLFDANPNNKKINESLADQVMAAARAAGLKGRVAGTPEQERERSAQIQAQRAQQRDAETQHAAQEDAKIIDSLRKELADMEAKYQSLGGSDWQYADREQNLTDAERKARAMEPTLHQLAARISRAQRAVAQESKKKDTLAAPAEAAHTATKVDDDFTHRLQRLQAVNTGLEQKLTAMTGRQSATKVGHEPSMAQESRKKSNEPPEVDYGPDYQAMVRRVGQLAKAGPLKTVWDPVKRVYRNVPVDQHKKPQ